MRRPSCLNWNGTPTQSLVSRGPQFQHRGSFYQTQDTPPCFNTSESSIIPRAFSCPNLRKTRVSAHLTLHARAQLSNLKDRKKKRRPDKQLGSRRRVTLVGLALSNVRNSFVTRPTGIS
jgi:hypothetical protein